MLRVLHDSAAVHQLGYVRLRASSSEPTSTTPAAGARGERDRLG